MCFEEGLLQSFLDGEVKGEKAKEISDHLAICLNCRRILEDLKQNSSFAEEKLAGYDQGLTLNIEEDWRKFLTVANYCDYKSRRKMIMTKLKKPLVAGVAGLVLVTSLAFSPMRGIASDFLKVFRVSKIQVVNLTLDDLQELKNNLAAQEGKINLDSFGQAEIIGKQKQTEISWSELKNIGEFDVKIPQYIPTGFIQGSSEGALTGTVDSDGKFTPFSQGGDGENTAFVQDGVVMKLNLNVQNVNSALESLRGTRLLPQGIDGKEFTITVSKTVKIHLAREKDYIHIMQSKSPEIIVPEGVEANQLYLALLDLPIIPEGIRSQLAGIEDWQNTLPVPSVEGSTEQVRVNGNEGVYIGTAHDAQGGSLIWQENGVIYTVNSSLDKEEIIKIASEMR